MKKCHLSIGVSLLLLICLQLAQANEKRPNVLFITIDDMNDWTTLFDPAAPIKTPNLVRLASKGMKFTKAYCASPACNPSRVSTLTGLRPDTTKVYDNSANWQKMLKGIVTLPKYFKQHGYLVHGAGKVFHHHDGKKHHDMKAFNDFQFMPHPPDSPMPKNKLNKLSKYGSKNTDWGVWPLNPDSSVDAKTVSYAESFFNQKHNDPFFLAIGIFRPHMPFFAPQEYLDLYPKESVQFPIKKENDWDDLPTGAKALMKNKKWFWEGMQKSESLHPGSWREAVRSYQAASTYADAQIGRLLDALEQSEYHKNTIILLWSDHGFHMGEKNHIEKFSLWEKATHIPFIISMPNEIKAGSICNTPIDTMSIYPTLLDLCNLPPNKTNEGKSLKPLLENPKSTWQQPALMTYLKGNHAVRTDHWRYIRYRDGSEELYDHRRDPHEWHNLAEHPEYVSVLKLHRAYLK